MPKYRKLPVEVDAEQFLPELGVFPKGVLYGKGGFVIETLEGKMRCKSGDWIITGVKGEKYPCKDEVFKLTYEKVGEERKASESLV